MTNFNNLLWKPIQDGKLYDFAFKIFFLKIMLQKRIKSVCNCHDCISVLWNHAEWKKSRNDGNMWKTQFFAWPTTNENLNDTKQVVFHGFPLSLFACVNKPGPRLQKIKNFHYPNRVLKNISLKPIRNKNSNKTK